MFSIIVPVYNIKDFLDECIQSVLQQTYSEWELILVDDGSTDRSAAICDEYVAADPRIQVIHKLNGGVSSARNTGLRQAKNEWIVYLDGDDKLAADALQSFVDLQANDADVDVIVGEVFLWCQEAVAEQQRPIQVDFDQSAQRCFAQIAQSLVHPIWSPWRSVYRRDFLLQNNLYFTEGILAEDMELFPKIALAAQGVAYNPTPFYFYRINRPGSFMATSNIKLSLDTCNVAAYWLSKMDKLGIDPILKAVLSDRFLRAAISYLAGGRNFSKTDWLCYTQALERLQPFSKTCENRATRCYYGCLGIFGPRITKCLMQVLHKPVAAFCLRWLKNTMH